MSCDQYSVENNSDQELADLRAAILSVGHNSTLDVRLILAIVLQESEGCVRAPTSYWSHANPGLMQSYQGTGSCNTNNNTAGAPVDQALVQVPCSASQIRQQIQDGAVGTQTGPGLATDWKQQGHTDVSGYYRTAKVYNAGIQTLQGSTELTGGPTGDYASDIANRLTGWLGPK